MQVTETKNDALKRAYNVTVDAKTIGAQMESELKSLSSKVKIAGFRPGRVPMPVLKKRYGKEVLGEVIERVVHQSSHKVVHEKELRPALQPKIQITKYEEGGDLDFSMEVELLPSVPELDFKKITLEKLVCAVEESRVEETLSQLAARNKTYTRAEKGAKAADGNQVLIDFVGKVDGVAFEGGGAKGFRLTLGSGQFIPGFEEQLIGTKEGKEVTVKVTFPESYHKDDLAGKASEFDVTVHEIHVGTDTPIDEELAKKMGFSDLEALRVAIREQFSGDYESAARAYMKKSLFDNVEKLCTFDIPEGMRELEFNGIWEKLQQAKKEGNEEISGKSDEALRTEYTDIAIRRVKLGILLSDVAAKNKITVNQDELSRAITQQARQFPGQEQRVFEFYQKNPQELENLRGPILEDKAVDFILSKVTIKERKVSHDELMKEVE